MRVICIDDKQYYESEAEFILKEKEIYEVVKTFQQGKPDWLWYELSGNYILNGRKLKEWPIHTPPVNLQFNSFK